MLEYAPHTLTYFLIVLTFDDARTTSKADYSQSKLHHSPLNSYSKPPQTVVKAQSSLYTISHNLNHAMFQSCARLHAFFHKKLLSRD